MANFSLWTTFGLCLLKLCLTETQFNVSCRYAGVFHVEKDGRYSLTRSDAVELCKALNSTLPTLEQMRRAHKLGFETCRYGFIVGHIVIPRINPYHLCAANHTGIYKLSSNTTGRYDAYCYNATETREKACEPIEKLDTSLLNNQSEIVIDNADGSRYNADGTRHSGDSLTSGADDESVGSGSTHDTAAVDTSTRRSTSTSYFEKTTPVSQRPDHSSGGGEKEFPPISTDDEFSTVSTDFSSVSIVDDFPEKGDGQQPASTTLVTSENEKHEEPSQHPLLHSVHPGWISQEQSPANTTGSTEQHEFTVPGENDIEKESSHTAVTSPDGAHHEDPTQPPLPSENEQGQGTAGITHATDTPRDEVLHGLNPAGRNEPDGESPVTGTIAESTEVVNQEEATKEPLAPGTRPGGESEQATTTDGSHANFIPGVFPDADDHLNRLYTPASTTVTSPDGAHHEDPTQPPLPSENEQGQGTAGITHATDTPRDEVLHGLNPAGRNEPDGESPVTGTIAESTEVVNQEEATKEPLAPGTRPGGESEQATTTDGSHANFIPGVFPDADDHLNRLYTPASTTVTSPDGAHHEDPTQPPLPSENEQGQGTAGITHATDTPRDEVLHGLNPAGRNEPDGESPVTGTTVTASTDKREDLTQGPWAPSTAVTAVTSPDGAHHEDPTQPPLPSENEQGQGTAGITHATDTPRDEVLHGLNPASRNEPDGESPVTGTIAESTEVVNQEEATKEPLAPGTRPGGESEQATTTDGSHANFIPGVFPDADDHLNRLYTPASTTVTSPDGAHHEDPTQPPLPSENEQGQGTAGITHATDTPRDEVLHGLNPAGRNEPDGESPVTGTIAESTEVVNQEEATKEPLAPGTRPGGESEQATTTDGSHANFIPGVFPDADDHLNRLYTPPPTRSTSSIHGNKGPHVGDHESTPIPGQTTTPVISQPRSARVPEWLIVVAALVALALILAVCIAVSSRRRCGQKKKLVINNGKGAVEDRKTGGLNGEASKSQEMVHLVHKEQSNDRTGACDEFLTLDETQNHQELDMKSGV
ncbi:CD44 antigen isoform X14 [Dromaius novaehollandiae]|uniref:CD44 antigen isoform X14 n=1 Tax=Dromaius novaehollandiae TaxID=8790 RepID=UPI00311DAAE6